MPLDEASELFYLRSRQMDDTVLSPMPAVL